MLSVFHYRIRVYVYMRGADTEFFQGGGRGSKFEACEKISIFENPCAKIFRPCPSENTFWGTGPEFVFIIITFRASLNIVNEFLGYLGNYIAKTKIALKYSLLLQTPLYQRKICKIIYIHCRSCRLATKAETFSKLTDHSQLLQNYFSSTKIYNYSDPFH